MTFNATPEEIAKMTADTIARRGFDDVRLPAHYNQGSIQVWDFIVDQSLDYLAGNVVKYVARYRHKGSPLKDPKKAKAYLEKLIAKQEADDARP